MRTLVTGGAGFIGSHLVERLVRDGHDVVVLDNLSTGKRENLDGVAREIDFREADLRDRVAVEEAVRGCEAVFHQAALAAVARSVEDPRLVTDVNVFGTLGVLLASRDAGVRRVVFASSSSVYGDTPTLPKVESMPTTPRSPYAASKAAGEAYLAAFQACYGLECVALRYFNVYGPRQDPRSQYAAVVPRFVEAGVLGRAPTIYGDGRQTRDFTYVTDVVDALLRATSVPTVPEGPVNLGGGRRISILDLWSEVARATGGRASPGHEPARAGDVRDSLADVTRAKTQLGWEPRMTLREGIARVVASWRTAPAV